MNYKETIDFLFSQLPQFQRIGAAAYKPGLSRVLKLSEYFGNPHERFRSIHVAGTNGKGSTSSLLAAVLQSAGYKVGLYTSPHLVDFRERIRVNGEMIPQEAVVDFVERWLAHNTGGAPLEPSFFELTMVMAFEHFAAEKIDVAVVEVGMGGRLDSTNIIRPELSIITNISKDHTQFLGNTLAQIATEKAGIIKPRVPVVIGEADPGLRTLFRDVAKFNDAPIYFAQDGLWYTDATIGDDRITYRGTPWGEVRCPLTGDYQLRNTATVMASIDQLSRRGWSISDRAVADGFERVCQLSGLWGRWSVVGHDPTIIADTGHNIGGWEYLGPRLASYGSRLRVIIGFVADKDVDSIMGMMPTEATYYFTQASIPRAMGASTLSDKAVCHGLRGNAYPTVAQAIEAARMDAEATDIIFIGGSTYIVGEALPLLPH